MTLILILNVRFIIFSTPAVVASPLSALALKLL